MKKLDGKYVPSTTDIKRAEAHARAIASKADYDGCVEVWFDESNGEFRFCECVGSTYMAANESDCKRIYEVECCRCK